MTLKYIKIAVSVLLCCALAVFFFVSPSPKVYGIEHARLKNGLDVYVIQNSRIPAVAHMIWYRVGAADDPVQQSGLAHYLEHLMFKGTKTVPEGELSSRVQRWGGADNAFTGYDYTAYFQTIPKERLIDVMQMEADRMRHLTPSENATKTELGVVINERKERTDNDPLSQLHEQVGAVLFGAHPYARPIIGPMGELQNLSWEKAEAQYKKYYAPNNAYVVLSGDISLAEAVRMATETYGVLEPSASLTPRSWPQVKPLEQDRVVTLNNPTVKQPVLTRTVMAPSYTSDRETALALTILAEIFAGSTGVLYDDLVVRQKLAAQVDVGYSAETFGPAEFVVSVTPVEGVDLNTLQQALDSTLKTVHITDTFVSNALQRIEDRSVFARDSLMGPAMQVGAALSAGIPAEVIDRWPRMLREVTLNQINQALDIVLAPAVYGRLDK